MDLAQSSACWHTRETSGGGGDYAPTLLLVGADAAGVALQLPAQLGPLPLYQDDDGYHSVLGPLLCRTTQKNEASTSTNDILAYNIPATLTLPRAKVFCGSSGCFGNSGPHTCSRRHYTCTVPECTWETPFATRQALNRHHEAVHLAERFDCPVPGCENVGQKGIKRFDNLVAHMKNRHAGAHPE